MRVFNFLPELNFKVNAERKSKVDDNTAKMQSIKWLGV
jgi:glycoside hydrolase